MIHDITPPITPGLAVWPGDTPVSREILCDLARGESVTLSTLRATVHLGAHADGPNHYGLNAPGIGERPLHHYLGPCQVIDLCATGGLSGEAGGAPASALRNTRITPAHLGSVPITEARILFRTNTFPDPARWNPDFAALSVELIHHLASRAVITVGIDTPSVDLQDSKDLPAHKAILSHDIAILEGLDLSAVAAGRYELIALPLKLMGFDASPVRAVLRSI